MKRYLLFDASCMKCGKLARAIEKDVNGWLTANSLRDPEMQALLNLARLDWRWQPTLLEVESNRVTAFTGISLVRKLVKDLGLKQTLHITQLIHQMNSPSPSIDLGRRHFLGQAGVVLSSLAILGIPGTSSLSHILLPQTKITNYNRYTDENYGFALEYPAEWQVETPINEPTPFIDSEAIIKRVTFSAPYALVYLNVWQANGRDFTTWLKWYADTRLVEGMLTVPNAAIAGKASLIFLERGTPDLLVAFVSDGQYVYRLMNRMTSVREALLAYWHILDTFTSAGVSALVAGIAPGIKEEAEQVAKLNGLLASNCCTYTSNGNPFSCCTNGNCTWWAYYKMGGVPFTGDAGTWWGQVPNYTAWARQTGAPPYNKRSIAWQSGTPGHVAYIAAYSGGANVNITDMCCGPDGQPPLNCWACVRTTPKPVSNYGGFIYRVNEPQ